MSKVDWSKAPDGYDEYADGKFWKKVKRGLSVMNESPCFNYYAYNLDGLTDYEKRPEKQVVSASEALESWGFDGVDGFSVKLPNCDYKSEQAKQEKDGNKYHREIIGFCGTMVEVDVYRVLDAFKTESQAIDHAVKKMLCTGIRGHKDYLTDIDNAIESLQEAKLLYLQKQEINKA